MKALSVQQPWANMIAIGYKTIETRTWETMYRGPLLICASKTVDRLAMESLTPDERALLGDMPTGEAICVADLWHCRRMEPGDEQSARCDLYDGAWSWVLKNVKAINPFPVKGQLGLFDVDDQLIELRGPGVTV